MIIKLLFKPLNAASDRMLNLDALRFFAALGVMFLHAAHYFEFGPGWSEGSVETLKLLVDLFFTISGFVMGAICADKVATFDPKQVGRFWFGRLARLYPLHIAMLLAFIVIGRIGLGQSANPEKYDAGCIPANLFLAQAWGGCSHLSFNGASWSVSAEFLMYALLPVFAWISARSRTVVLAGAAVSMAVLTILTAQTPAPWFYWMTPLGALRALPSFLFGLSLWNYRGVVERIPFAQAGLWICMAAYVAGVAFAGQPLPLLGVIWLIVLFAVASDAHQGADPVMRALAPLGTLTYASYMIHTLVFIAALKIGVGRAPHLHGVARNLVVFATIALTFALAWPVENLADAVKRWLNRAVRI